MKKATIKFASQNGIASVQRQYQKLLLKYQRRYAQILKEETGRLIPQVKQIQEIGSQRNYVTLIDECMDRVNCRLKADFPDQVLMKWAAAAVSRVNKLTDQDVVQGAQKKLRGKANIRFDSKKVDEVVDIIYPDLAIQRQLTPFHRSVIRNNLDLIRGINIKNNTELRNSLAQMLIDNRPSREIQKLIVEKTKKTKAQARLIARDQIGKLNARSNANKQKALGVTKYIWRTVRDARVRDKANGGNHKALEGKVFSWNKPPIVNSKTGKRAHPGEDFQCRCYAEAVLDDLIN